MPEIRLLGRIRTTMAGKPLPLHRHAGAYEICCLAEGVLMFSVAGRDYVMHPGDIFVTRPDEQHSTGNQPRERHLLYWMQVVPPRRGHPFLALAPAAGRALAGVLREIACRRLFRGDPAIRQEMERLVNEALCGGRPVSPWPRLRAALRVQQVLLLLAESARQPPRTATGDMNRALEYVDAHLEEPMRVASLAAACGLSVPRFKARFRQVVGMPPARYVLRRRIHRARALLAAGRYTVTEVAHMMGFSSSQNFATVYRRWTNRSPREDRSSIPAAVDGR